MKTKNEFRIELERRMRERIYHGMLIEAYHVVLMEVTFEVIAECMADAGVLKDH